ncbi:hypothetical protein [Klebsiella pneumoniae IS53]|nr:hypothetical protein [Klebsiella pneumoniae IS53]
MEQRQFNTGFFAGFDQRVLRLVLRPGGGHHAGIFSGVRVADHDHLLALDKAAVPVDIQQLGHDVVGVVEVIQRFEQRGHRQSKANPGFFQQEMNRQHIGRRFRHRDHVGGDRSARRLGDHLAGVENFTRLFAWLPLARQQRTFGIQFADQESLFVGFRPAFVVADPEVTGHFTQRFGMAGAFLTNINTHQRYAERLHAAQGVEQLAVGDNAHAAGLQRFIAGVQRLPQLLVLSDQSRRFRQLLAFQARFQPGLGLHQLRAQFFHQITVRFLSALGASQGAQLVGTLHHRQLGDQHLHVFEEQVGRFPAAEQQHVAGDVGSHVRVAVAVAAHPRGETHRDEVHRQLIAKVGFQLFVQLAQIVRHPFPQAVFHHREAPFGFIDRGRAVLTNFIGMPRLGDQLAQTAH